jgi:hypothetical protein
MGEKAELSDNMTLYENWFTKDEVLIYYLSDANTDKKLEGNVIYYPSD